MSQIADFRPSRSSGYIPTKEQRNSVNDLWQLKICNYVYIYIHTYIYIYIQIDRYIYIDRYRYLDILIYML